MGSLAARRTGPRAPTPMLAVGTATGNIDVFDVGGPRISKEPVKSIPNLVTFVDSLRFHHSGELLVGASRGKEDALKVVHMGTGTVFKDWPTSRTPLQRVTALDLSRRSGYLAIGNERGRVLLYQLGH